MIFKKRSIRIFVSILCSFICIHQLLTFFDKTFIYRALFYNYVDIDDYKIFSNKILPHSNTPQEWPLSDKYNQYTFSNSTQKLLDSLETIAVLVIKNDSVYFEQYYNNHKASSISNSFSVAKSYVSALIGVALKEGKIKSLDQKVSEFLEGFDEGGKEKITLRHLLTMSSGLYWDESYASPFSVTTEAYYGNDLYKLIQKLKIVEEPGKVFRYKSCDTQILSFILKKATGMSIAEYASEKLWKPMGCTSDALWSLDAEHGNEKAYCCLNATARDFAKIAKLYIQNGIWNNDTLISPEYIKASLRPSMITDGETNQTQKTNYYGYQWWLLNNYKGINAFYARGILGQYIIAIPEQNKIIVRLGKKRGKKTGHHYQEMLKLIDECYKW